MAMKKMTQRITLSGFLILLLYMIGCSQPRQIGTAVANPTPVSNEYRLALSYLQNDPKVLSYCWRQFKDSTAKVRMMVSKSVLKPSLYSFYSGIVYLKYGLIRGSRKTPEFREYQQGEIMTNEKYVESFQSYDDPRLQGLGAQDSVTLVTSFSELLSDIVAGRELLLAEVRPVYTEDQQSELRERGVATDMCLRCLFVFNSGVIDTVMSGLIAY